MRDMVNCIKSDVLMQLIINRTSLFQIFCCPQSANAISQLLATSLLCIMENLPKFHLPSGAKQFAVLIDGQEIVLSMEVCYAINIFQ